MQRTPLESAKSSNKNLADCHVLSAKQSRRALQGPQGYLRGVLRGAQLQAPSSAQAFGEALRLPAHARASPSSRILRLLR